jgi:hypothetical protein
MGFNRRKMEDQPTDVQVLEDAERLIAAWNERQTKRMPMLFSPTIGAAIAYAFCGCAVRHAERSAPRVRERSIATATSVIPALSCRSCRPNAPFAELVRLSRTSIADEMREERRRRMLRE